ncbi:alpha/beta fold hydrolase [Marinicrinis sediminis]|uniref:Alpha/beta fold hydrolase n=1 Tax=Marinicrinis sediminis TaxID=1652465 RepID=A0ABW5RES6_9BACL
MPSNCWEEVLPFFSNDKHQIVKMENGHTLADWERMLSEAIRMTPDEPLAIVGWSMGGILALDVLARMHKEAPASISSVKRIVLVSTTLKFTSEDRQLGWPERIMHRMIHKCRASSEVVFQDFAAAMLTQAERHQTERKLAELLVHSSWSHQALLAGLQYLCEADVSQAYVKLLEEKDIQIDWIHGTQDATCPAAALRKLEQRDGEAKGKAGFLWVEQGGHALPLSHPAQLASHIHTLWKRTPMPNGREESLTD